ncbi:MAG: hypothetical protein FD123_4077 [Bacteroidetes bacterium]|nr:MAG: hypothetical protein FD123_4077 [Bacteroidota bacterium]
MLADILLTFFLVLLNAFFVAAEFAIVKVRSSQIELKANQGSSRAKIAQHIHANLDAYLSASQLGITLASLALGWIGESVVFEMMMKAVTFFGASMDAATMHTVSIIVAFTLITVLHIVLGEQAPKSFAIRYPLEMTMAVAYPLRVFYLVFRPFIWMVNGLSKVTLRLLGMKRTAEDQDIHSEEELRMLLTESEEGGAIKQSEHDLIQNVFEFDDRVVKNIMVPRTKITAIDIDLSPQEILDRMIDEGYSRMPVYRDTLDNVIGVIYTKDLLRLMKTFKVDRAAIESVIRPVHFIPANKRVNDLLREFQRLHIQMAVVTTEYGGTAGLVTMEDIIEELVGEIQDEYDEEKPVVEKKSDTEYIVNAMSGISDINDHLPIALPESPHYETVSGLVNFIFGRIPAVNETKEYGGYRITILKRFRHSVESVRMQVLDPNYTTELSSKE